VGNNNGQSVNCAEGYDLSGLNGTAGPVWPVNTLKALTFVIDATGKVVSLEMGGVAAMVAPVATGTTITPGCQPLNIPDTDVVSGPTKLFIGASGNPQVRFAAAGPAAGSLHAPMHARR
jgi:hypothetical protein